MPKQQAQCRVLKCARIDENILPSYITHYCFGNKSCSMPANEYDQIMQKGVLKSIYAGFETPLQ